jgi:DNA repair protein RecN (Recombination protein N)
MVQYRALWAQRAALARDLDELTRTAAVRAQEAEALRRGLAEVERIDPQPGEDTQLAAVISRLSHAEELRQAAVLAHVTLAGDDTGELQDNTLVTLDRARRALDGARGADEELGRFADRLADSGYQVADVVQEISGYLADLAADPAALEIAQTRRAELSGLRTYGQTTDEVLAWSAQAGLRLLDLDDSGGRTQAMTALQVELDAQITALAGNISAARQAAATALGQAVSTELVGLAMPGARFSVDVVPAEAPGPWGGDTVTFRLSPHAGAAAQPLGKGASGGELSRVMLAIEVALAGSGGRSGAELDAGSGTTGVELPGAGPGVVPGAERDMPRPTFVFDEVDAGVGGQAAVEVGRRLALLACDAQVLVVTHFAQVAAYADHHIVVTKTGIAGGTGTVAAVPGDAMNESAGITVTGVREVTGDERVRELARMLSGQQDSATARQHAVELLEMSAGENIRG